MAETPSPAAAPLRVVIEPPASVRVVIEPPRGWVAIDWTELWRYRELIGFLALRDFQVRYKQSLLGASWAVLQPLLTMAVFTLLFSALLGRGRMPSVEGVPYEVSTYCALVPWQFFATSVAASGRSLVANQSLITKVYFPRLTAPVAPVLASAVDLAIAFVVLLAMLLWFGVAPGWNVVALPAFALMAGLAALGISLWLSALNAVYRDVQYAIPFLVQLWMFASPVVYSAQSVTGDMPDWALALYALNPMVGVIEGFRWSLLGSPAPPLAFFVSSSLVIVALLVGGAYYFRRMERVFADRV